MKLDLKYLFLITLLVMCFQLNAQLQFSIAVDIREIGKKDELQVDYIVSGTDKINSFKPPYFTDWRIISGPDFSSVSYDVNGKKDQTAKYSYVLKPQTTGTLKLPGTTIVADNKKLSCHDLIITVKKQDHVDGVPPPGSSLMFQGGLTMHDVNDEDDFVKEYTLKPGEDPIKKIRNNLFIKAIPSKTKVYVGEPVLVTYKLYTRLKSHSRVIKQPTFEGCSVHEMTTNDVLPEKETINGKVYNSYLFRKVQLFPLQPGQIEISKASVENTVSFLTKGSDLRDLYYDNKTGNEQTVILNTDPFAIEVIPLPKAVNTHTIGDFTISAKLKKDTIPANEQNALLITVEGKGNFKSLNEPEVQWPENIYHFDGIENDTIDKLSFPLSGKRVYEIPFETNTTGKFSITPIALSFFNPANGKVQNVRTNALQLTVTPAVRSTLKKSIAAVEGQRFNIKLLYYAIPVFFLLGILLITRKPKAKLQAVAAANDVEPTHTISKQLNVDERFNNLLLVQGDAEFYHKARSLAQEMMDQKKGDQQLLSEVLKDCNTMLYTPMPITSKKEILDKLRLAIT